MTPWKNRAIGAELAATAACAFEGLPSGETSFSQLSDEAKELIIDAALYGDDYVPPPDIPESVREEIRRWAEQPDNNTQ